jgi:hypothetical protein
MISDIFDVKNMYFYLSKLNLTGRYNGRGNPINPNNTTMF